MGSFLWKVEKGGVVAGSVHAATEQEARDNAIGSGLVAATDAFSVARVSGEMLLPNNPGNVLAGGKPLPKEK